MSQNKVLSLLSIAARGRNLVSGEFAVESTVKADKAFLVVIAADVSENTKKKFTNMCDYYQVPLFSYGTKEELGHAIGKEFRASLAVTDGGLAKTIINKLETHEE